MQTLPTDPDSYPEDAELKERDCAECGATGYVVAEYHSRDGPHRCESCVREDFCEYLDPGTDTAISRKGALVRLARSHLLPIQEPTDAAMLITNVEVSRGPKGEYPARVDSVVREDCPRCGYDRATEIVWRHFTVESGLSVRCRVCDHEIRERSSL